jgi:hypothetical protein
MHENRTPDDQSAATTPLDATTARMPVADAGFPAPFPTRPADDTRPVAALDRGDRSRRAAKEWARVPAPAPDLTIDRPPAGDPLPGRTARSIRPLLVAAAIGGAVALSLGVYGRVHSPTLDTVESFGFPDVLSMKAWFASGAAVLALLQLTSALWMWGRLPGAGAPPAWVASAHRWTGTVAFLLTLPAAYHCLWSLGFQDTDARVLTHSILGCAFYGAFTTKMLVLRSKTAPRWAVPVMGGALVALLAAIWLTSSLWFFTNVGFPGV